MISNYAERQLVARDETLHGLAAVLDPELLNDCLSKLPDARILVGDREYIRYKPETNCLVSYQHESAKPSSAMYAKAYTEEFEQKFAKDSHRATRDWAPREKTWAIPEHRVLVRQFPMDGRLRALKVLADSNAFQRFVGRTLPGKPDTSDVRVETLAYKAERRYVAKLSGKEIGEVVLKFYGSRAFIRSLANLRYLTWIGCNLTPRLLGHSRRRQALALEWRRGPIFREVLNDLAQREGIAASIGKALAKLHTQPASNELQRWSLQTERVRVRSLTDTLAYLLPDHAAQTRRVGEQICKRLMQSRVDSHLIHGDFHSKQILVSERGIRFLDVDELAVGPAQLDIGTFIAHLYRDALCGRTSRNVARMISGAFLDGYRSAGGRTDNVSAFTALALLKFSHHPFRASESDWDEGVERVIDLAAEFASHTQNKTKK